MVNVETAGEDGEPIGDVSLRTLAMPADTNPQGDIFGGWLLAQMDIAGGLAALQRARGRVATVAIDSMTFHKPVYVGDVVCCYTLVERVGTTSIQVRVQAWVIRGAHGDRRIKVTEGLFTYVAVDAEGKPRSVETPGPGMRGRPMPRLSAADE